MSEVWSEVLQRYVPEDKKDALEAYHQRITQGNANERAMQQGAENYANKPVGVWNNLKALMGGKN